MPSAVPVLKDRRIKMPSAAPVLSPPPNVHAWIRYKAGNKSQLNKTSRSSPAKTTTSSPAKTSKSSPAKTSKSQGKNPAEVAGVLALVTSAAETLEPPTLEIDMPTEESSTTLPTNEESSTTLPTEESSTPAQRQATEVKKDNVPLKNKYKNKKVKTVIMMARTPPKTKTKMTRMKMKARRRNSLLHKLRS